MGSSPRTRLQTLPCQNAGTFAKLHECSSQSSACVAELRKRVFFGFIHSPVQRSNSFGKTGAEDGRERRGAGEMRQIKTAPMNITLQGLRGGDGSFSTELKLLRYPPSWGPWPPAPLTEPPLQLPSAGHGVSLCSAPLRAGSRSTALAPCTLPLAPVGSPHEFLWRDSAHCGCGLARYNASPNPSGCSSPRWRAE